MFRNIEQFAQGHWAKSCSVNIQPQKPQFFPGKALWFLFFFKLFWPHPAACGILVPWPGIKPVPPALEDKILIIEPPGKSWFWSRLSYSRSQWNLRNNASWSTHHGRQSGADPSAGKCLGWVMKIKRFCSSRGSKSCHCIHREGGGLL